MNKTKLFIGISAFALSICGFVATKANKRFVSVTSGFFLTAGGGQRGQASSLTAGFNTISTGRGLVQMKTAGGTKLATLYTGTNPSTKKVYH